MANYGADYNAALNAWNERSLQDRLATLGISGSYDEGGNMRYYKNGELQRYDGSQEGPTSPEMAGAFDSAKYFTNQGILPLRPGWTDQSLMGMDDATARAYQDNWARSFNIGGYNFNNYDDYLRNQTGAGQWENDPTLGPVWVPQNRDSNTWNYDTNSRTANNQAGFLGNAVNNFADAGGLVYGLAGAGAAGIASGALGGAGGLGELGSAGSMFSNLPTWAGGAADTALGGGIGGTGLGAAAAPAIGSAAGSGIASAVPGFLSDLPAWAGGAGGTSLGGSPGFLDQITKLFQGAPPGTMEKVLQAATGGGAAGAAGGAGGTTGSTGGGGLLDLLKVLGGAYAGSQTSPNIKSNLPGSIDTALFNAAQASNPNFQAGVAQQLKNINGEYLDPTKNLAVQGQLQALNDQFTSKTLPGAVGAFYGKNQAGPAYENSAFANPFTSKSGAPNSILGNLSADLGRGQGQAIQQGYTSALQQMNASGALAQSQTPFSLMNQYAQTAYGKPIFQTDPLAGAIMGGIGAYAGNQAAGGGAGGGAGNLLSTGADWLTKLINGGGSQSSPGVDMTGFTNTNNMQNLFGGGGSGSYAAPGGFTGLFGNDNLFGGNWKL